MLERAAFIMSGAAFIIMMWANFSKRPVSNFNIPAGLIAAGFISIAAGACFAHDNDLLQSGLGFALMWPAFILVGARIFRWKFGRPA